MARLLNGEYLGEILEAQRIVLSLSHVLVTQEKFACSDVVAAITAPMQRVLQDHTTFSWTPRAACGVMEDVSIILSDKHLVMVALSELYRLLVPPATGKPPKRVVLGNKKVLFYLSWAEQQPASAFEGIVMFVQLFKREELERVGKHESQKKVVEAHREETRKTTSDAPGTAGRPLIEEIV